MGSKLQKLVEQDEGRVPYAYQDSLGYWTIGVGFLIDKRKGARVPDAVINFWFEYEMSQTEAALRAALPWVATLDEVRYAVLANMAYNLGVPGLLKFKNTLSMIEGGRYADASSAMLDSLWASQVKGRAKRLAEMMRSGEWPPGVT